MYAFDPSPQGMSALASNKPGASAPTPDLPRMISPPLGLPGTSSLAPCLRGMSEFASGPPETQALYPGQPGPPAPFPGPLRTSALTTTSLLRTSAPS